MNLKNLWHFIRLQVNQLQLQHQQHQQLQLQLICNASGLSWGLLSSTTATSAAATPQAQQQLLPVLSGNCLVMLISIRCDCSPLRPRVCSRSQLQPRLVGGRHKDLSFTHSLTYSLAQEVCGLQIEVSAQVGAAKCQPVAEQQQQQQQVKISVHFIDNQRQRH